MFRYDPRRARRSNWRAGALAVAVAIAIGMHGNAAANPPPSAGAVPFHIAAGTLDEALRQLATQSHMQVLYAPALVKGIRVAAFAATASTEEALKALLHGTHLTYEFTDANTIAIKAAAANGGGSASASAAVAPASAQSDPPAGDKPAALESVVVTATKRAQSVESIPGSIAVITGSELEKRGAQNLANIVELVPGVNLTSPASNAARITIRGISGEANTNPTAGILFDDISFLDSYVPHVTLDPNPFDMENVEVLKGPQGTLFGASALNGAIRYVPVAPDFGALEGKYYVQGGSVSHGNNPWGAGAMINVPLTSDTLALRVVAYDSGTPGWIDNVLRGDKDGNRGHQSGQRAILAWKPNEALQVQLTYATQRTTQHDIGEANNRDGVLANDDHLRQSPWSGNYDLTSLKVQYDFGAFDFVSSTGYVWKDYRSFIEGTGQQIPGGGYPLVATTYHDTSNSWSQELRLVSKDDADSNWRWVGGVFASHQSISQRDAYPLGDPSLSPLTAASLLDRILLPGAGAAWLALGQPPYEKLDLDVQVKELAAFFDVTRKFGDSWEASIGGRLYRTSSGGTADNTGLLLALTGSPNGRYIDQTVKDSGFDPKVSLQWHVTDSAMLYGAVSKGYRVGGVQWGVSGLFTTMQAPPTFKTDTIWNYEIGLRSRWLDNTLQVDATAFYEKWNNPQVLVFTEGGLGSYIDNVGGVTSKGVETSLQYLFPQVSGLKFRFAATYNLAKTTSDFVTAVSTQPLVPKGTAWPLSPKWQGAATLDYQRSMGSWYWGGYLTDAYIGRATYGINQPDTVFGYSEVDAQLRVGFSTLPTSPEISLSLNNAFDRRGITTAYSGGPAYPWHEVTYIQPRTWMLRLSGSY
ncbi:MAG: TonB-dependent receptor [Rudaea sp.]|uniref:TonB-dependent receptor domain-containing protein n=1 Tax=unclassified Rudaea TaxID=2627037 RepID=UPI0010F78721|nr:MULTISPECIES: TonB-dependent receptor [unclassified Rudaea]MBN8886769.1 TonB-dependent receptor [Rudaea sp.]MBR0347815.1 TonB-dependent receptor [Rudaea sp.]